MYEYEFRVVVPCDKHNFDSFIKDTIHFLKGDRRLFVAHTRRIFYIKPHFRLKEPNTLEWKQVLTTRTIYHDGLWFRFVESEEISFAKWSKRMTIQFLERAGHTSHPVSTEFRHELSSDIFPCIKLYAYRKFENMRPRYGIVFEFEIGCFDDRHSNPTDLAASTARYQLSLHKRIYGFLKHRLFSSSRLCTSFSSLPPSFGGSFSGDPSGDDRLAARKPVVPLHVARAHSLLSSGSVVLMAPKHDGTFGFVHSRADMLREVWEDNVRRIHRNVTLGTDLVFGAERMSDGSVVLLDVYSVAGCPVRTTESLLTEFLPKLTLPKQLNYRVQTYRSVKSGPLFLNANKNQDGIVLHDVTADVVYKVKEKHTVELIHFDGAYMLPNGEKMQVPIEFRESLRNGSVYECAIDTFIPLRRRDDRFVGNSAKQWSLLTSAATTSATFSTP